MAERENTFAMQLPGDTLTMNLTDLHDESPFQRWLQENTNGNRDERTTLEQQVTLAKQLYDEAERPGDTDVPVETIVANLRQTPIDNRDLVNDKGIQVAWFLDVFCKTSYAKLLIAFGCPMWFVRKVCVVEMLRRKGIHFGAFIDNVVTAFADDVPESSDIVKSPTTFISYTGRYTFEYFVNMLEHLRGEYVWIDVFCVDQFAWTGRSRSEEMQKCREDLTQGLMQKIQKINKTALMLEKWNDAMWTLKQIWVLWEIFNTVEAKASFTLLMPAEEVVDFVRSLESGSRKFQTIQAMLADIDCDEAKAEDSVDRHMILDLMKERGFANVNRQVTAQLRSWLINTARAHLKKAEKSDIDVGFWPRSNFASLLKEQGELEEAETWYREALNRNQQHFGNDDKDTYSALHNLSDLLRARYKLSEAEPLCRAALAGKREKLGDDDASTLRSMNALADLLLTQQKYGEAEPVGRECLSTRRRTLGEAHPETLTSMNTLALTLLGLENYVEAEKLFREAVKISTRLHGDQHPHTLVLEGNFAIVLGRTGEQAEAEAKLLAVLEVQRLRLGRGHPDTLYSTMNLASLYQRQNRLDEAEVLIRDSLVEAKRLFGDANPRTRSCKDELIEVLLLQSKFSAAESLLREVLAERRCDVNNGYREIAWTVHKLARVLQVLQRYEEAEPLFREATDRSRVELGECHLTTLEYMLEWASVLVRINRFVESQRLVEDVLSERQRQLGSDHLMTLEAANELGNVFLEQGKYTELEALCRKTLQLLEDQADDLEETRMVCLSNLADALFHQRCLEEGETLMWEVLGLQQQLWGAESPKTHRAMRKIYIMMEEQGKFTPEAEELCRVNLRNCRDTLGNEDVETLQCISSLGKQLFAQRRFGEAEVLLRESLKGRIRVLGPDHRHTVINRTNLVHALEAQGKFQKAQALRDGLSESDDEEELVAVAVLSVVAVVVLACYVFFSRKPATRRL